MLLVPEQFRDRNVCILGLGYVGLTLATTMAEVGFRVVGVEINQDIVEQLRSGRPHFSETGLGARLQRVVGEGALEIHERTPVPSEASVYIITVGTPLDGERRVRLDMIAHAAGEVAAVLRDDDLVVLRSTVKVGTTTEVVRPVLEAAGRRFHLAFCPERTLEGRALEELRHLPQIVGGADDAAAIRAAQLFQFVTPTVIRVSDAMTAEVIKLVDNTYRDVRFAFANEVARLCDAIGVSALEVVQNGKLGYPRTDVPLPGPVGGPCLEKDPMILVQSFEHLGVVPEITVASRQVNERQLEEVADYIARSATALPGFSTAPTVAMLGLAFKGRPATDDLRGTTALPVLTALRDRLPGATFRGFDAEVAAGPIADLGLVPAPTLEQALEGADLAVILNNHPVFEQAALDQVAAGMARPALIYDLWNTYDVAAIRLPPGVGYAALGSHGRALLPHEFAVEGA